MKLTLINWIKTENWEGALIEDTNKKKFLTNGVNKWTVEPHRKYEIVDSINEAAFYKYWNEYFRYCSLENTITVKCTYSNDDTITTSINLTLRNAENHFIGSWRNLGTVGDNMQQCVAVELV